ncbi:epoxide hydrolase [Ceratobasidium sp. AG-Ba]|nr:epoxide hydrolase [Ceratobasidium sp. AG-Ba]
MKTLIQQTHLPNTSVLNDPRAGTSLSWLKARQKDWISSYNWNDEQAKLNKFNHSTVDIGNMTVHFIHQRASQPDAIPLLLTHGWPGSFYEFSQVITPLSNPRGGSNTSFHVIVPSLPGFGFSSPAPPGWTVNSTATLFNTLVTDVLGYKSYVAVGGDWGCIVTWGLHNNHPENIKAVMYTGLIPMLGPTVQFLQDNPLFADKAANLSAEEKQKIDNNSIFQNDGMGYFLEQSTRPSTIGLALYDNPIGQLSWISQLYFEGADPLIGVSPSTLNNNTILTSVSLYYLTGTFETAANIYYQNLGTFVPGLRRAVNQLPMGFSTYKYEAQ